jgi:hypothetical protein
MKDDNAPGCRQVATTSTRGRIPAPRAAPDIAKVLVLKAPSWLELPTRGSGHGREKDRGSHPWHAYGIVVNDLQDGNLATCSYRDRVSVSLRALDSMRS